MKKYYYSRSLVVLSFLLGFLPLRGLAATTNAVILPTRVYDLHAHALKADVWLKLFSERPDWGQCTNDSDTLRLTVQEMDKFNIKKALLQGDNNLVDEWVRQYPDRFIAAYTPEFAEPDFPYRDHESEARKFGNLIAAGRYKAIGELGHVYIGLPLDWPALDWYLREAEKRGIPVMYHTGNPFPEGTPAHTHGEKPEEALGAGMEVYANPKLLDNVCRKFPKLQIVACHAGMSQFEELIKVMKAWPNVHADISYINWNNDDGRLGRIIIRFVEEGLEDRIHYGSDQMVYPPFIGKSIISTATVLSNKRRLCDKVFFENTAKLLKLTDEHE